MLLQLLLGALGPAARSGCLDYVLLPALGGLAAITACARRVKP